MIDVDRMDCLRKDLGLPAVEEDGDALVDLFQVVEMLTRRVIQIEEREDGRLPEGFRHSR